MDGVVLGCATVETISAIRVTHMLGSTVDIEQLLPYFTFTLYGAGTMTYTVLREVGPSVCVVCQNLSAVFDLWPGDQVPQW